MNVDLPGFEPRLTEPKSVVLPLHHRSVVYFGTAKIYVFLFPPKFLEDRNFKKLFAKNMEQEYPGCKS